MTADGDRVVIDRLSAVLRHGYAIAVSCGGCGRSVYLNLPVVIALDGDRELFDLKLRCSGCGRRAPMQLVHKDALRLGVSPAQPSAERAAWSARREAIDLHHVRQRLRRALRNL